MEQLAAEAGKAEAQATATRSQSWKAWCEKALESGASAAHKYVRGQATWGRLSVEAEHTLATCAALAARRDHRRWQLASSAQKGMPGHAPQRRRATVDLVALELGPAGTHAQHNPSPTPPPFRPTPPLSVFPPPSPILPRLPEPPPPAFA